VGKLGEFRQILLEYILGKEEYMSYSHMVILDADLGTSLSPLGLIHTLGLDNGIAHDHAVASSSSQVWPGTISSHRTIWPASWSYCHRDLLLLTTESRICEELSLPAGFPAQKNKVCRAIFGQDKQTSEERL
jgi:hypothetical protein